MAARNAAIARAVANRDGEGEDNFGSFVPFKPQVRNLLLPPGAPILPALPEGTEQGGFADVKSKLWMVFEEPDSCWIANIINIWVLFLIILSAIVACVETVPTLHRTNEGMWIAIEGFFVGNFTIELILRFLGCPDRCEFVQSGMNWIDVISIMPFYSDLIVSAVTDAEITWLSILRLARSLRLVKLFRYSTGMQMISHCMVQSSDALQLFTIIFSGLIVLCASAIYYSERGAWLVPTNGTSADGYYDRYNLLEERYVSNPFASVPESLWWCITTLTTVGYGDIAPVTLMGRIVGLFTILLGVICVAMPLSIIGANFHEINASLNDEEEKEKKEKEEGTKGEKILSPIDDLYNCAEASEEADELLDMTMATGDMVYKIVELQRRYAKRLAKTQGSVGESSSIEAAGEDPSLPGVGPSSEQQPVPDEPAVTVDLEVKASRVAVNQAEHHRVEANGIAPEGYKPAKDGGGVADIPGMVLVEHFHMVELELLLRTASMQCRSIHEKFAE